MGKFKLFSNFIVVNATGFALLFLAYINGWFKTIIEADSSRVCLVILALFLYALGAATWRMILLSGAMGKKVDFNKNSSAEIRALEIKIFSPLKQFNIMSNAMVVLGLVGTVIGFIFIASSIDADTAANVDQVGSLVGVLLHGMGIAFYTTLVGALLSLWLSLIHQMLHSASAQLLAQLLSR